MAEGMAEAEAVKEAPFTPERNLTSLPHEVVAKCLGQVELALHRGNREEAEAAIAAAFAVDEPEGVTLDSPVVDLRLSARVLNVLEHWAIYTVRDLCNESVHSLAAMEFGRRAAKEIRLAVERCGYRLSRPRSAVQA